ncbi:MAG: DUF1385 domain-containing protein [Armatimonadetes bacterium]|nr:DUF1385 domain-containing protein [Armatimonadota bacterium]
MPQSDYLTFGGQAIVEGVMMRSPHYFAVACRAPNGKIVLRTEAIEKTWIGRQKWLKLPFLRGTFAILDSLALGTRAMRFATHIQMDPEHGGEELESKPTPTSQLVLILILGVLLGAFGIYLLVAKPDWAATGLLSKQGVRVLLAFLGVLAAVLNGASLYERVSGKDGTASAKRIQNMAVAVSMVVGIGMGVLLFNVLPQFIAQILGNKAGDSKGTFTNYLAEVVKIAVFLGYLWLISRMEAIREVFRYHGAEHKAINTWEADQPLTMEKCQIVTRLHPRCGTSFAVIVFIVSLFFLPLVPRYPITGKPGALLVDVPVRVLMEMCILPIIAGISYELLRLAGKLRNQKWVQIAFSPGLASQRYLTTLEPDPKHIEVALASLKAVVHAEQTGEVVESDNYDEDKLASQVIDPHGFSQAAKSAS